MAEREGRERMGVGERVKNESYWIIRLKNRERKNRDRQKETHVERAWETDRVKQSLRQTEKERDYN
jgi:hypothetical protein